MIDAHIHLDQYSDKKLRTNIPLWQELGIKHVIAVSTNLASAYRTLELKVAYPHFVKACIGFHPEFAQPTSKEIDEMKQLIKIERTKLTAIGEIGLPHYEANHVAKMPFYIQLLDELLATAKEYQLPVALHAVHDKAATALSILQKNDIQQAHFHWFKGPKDVLSDIIQCGYYVSITPEICYLERDQKLVQHVPFTNC